MQSLADDHCRGLGTDDAPYDAQGDAATTCASEDVSSPNDKGDGEGVLEGECWRHLRSLREAGLQSGWLVPFDELEVRGKASREVAAATGAGFSHREVE